MLSFLTNPLGSVPGPFYTRITSYVFHRKIFSGARFYYVHALHQKYGPVVRIAPDEVSVADLASVKRIHGIGTPFTKTDWYKNRTNLTAPALFTEKDPHLHAQYRRLLANAMSETSLTTSGFEEMIKTKVDRWNEKVQTDLKAQGWSDFLQWDTFLSTDTIGELTFGSSFDTLKIGKVSKAFGLISSVPLSKCTRQYNSKMMRSFIILEPRSFVSLACQLRCNDVADIDH